MVISNMVENHQRARVRPLGLPRIRIALLIFISNIAMAIPLSAQTPEPVRYTVRFPAPQTHYVSVEAILPVAGQNSVEVFMPVWTPGSYLVRESRAMWRGSKYPIPPGNGSVFTKSRKNRWRVETGGAREIRFSYKVYCREMSVRTNWVEDSFALLNGAPTFVTLVGGLKPASRRETGTSSGLENERSGLPEVDDGGPNHYIAADYDTLVDSPIVAGNPAVYRFEVDGIPHYLVNEGEAGVWDGPRSAADTEKIVRQYRADVGFPALPQEVRVPEHDRRNRAAASNTRIRSAS